MNIDELKKAKSLIENKKIYNNNLLEAIDSIKQDEIILKNENKIYDTILKVLNKEIKQETINIINIINDKQQNNKRIQDITKKIL